MTKEALFAGGLLIDQEDEWLLDRYTWNFLSPKAQRLYVIRNAPAGEEAYLHRMIMGSPRDGVVDHINRDKRDNRRSNLRVVPSYVNGHNTNGATKVSTTGMKTVFRRPETGSWRVRIKVNRREFRKGFKCLAHALAFREQVIQRELGAFIE